MIQVASYCRVSTDKDDQNNSFESQQQYFREYIDRRPDWTLYAVYADEGITGTSTKKRTQFNRMIDDAYAGKFRLIITKEVSRFSRNILDTISYTRELKAIGVGVLFVIDGINTLNPDAELYLSIMSSLAQEESRKTSSRVVWGQTRQMEKGVVFGRSLLGYHVNGGIISIEPTGAEIVRLIFQKYAVEQLSAAEIARFLTRKGYRTYSESTKWRPNAVIKILKNEKYVGDLIQKKTYTPDYLSHEKQKNRGEVPLICIENHHEPIVSRELWDLTQERLHRNNTHTEDQIGHSNRYVFSGKIRCGECGAAYVGNYVHLRDGTKYRRWRCGTAVRDGVSGCSIGILVRDDHARYLLKTALENLHLDRNTVIDEVASLAIEALQEEQNHTGRLNAEIHRTEQKKQAMLDSFFSGDISKEDMRTLKQMYEQQLEALHKQLENETNMQSSPMNPQSLKAAIRSELHALVNGSVESDILYKTMLESLTVFKDRHMELRLNHLSQIFYFRG